MASLECVHIPPKEECADGASVLEGLRFGWVLSEQEATCTPVQRGGETAQVIFKTV